jgi:hypothetical protein
MAEAVYVLCAVASVICAVMLLNGYRESKARLLFWGSLCFVGFALNNVLLFVDLVVTGPMVDLRLVRHVFALVSMGVLIHGLVSETAQ